MNQPERYVNGGLLQFTLREMQRFATNPRFWIIIIVVTIILGVSGPFSTLKEMATVPRFAYWAAICVFTFFANLAVVLPILEWLRARKKPRWMEFVLPSIAGSIPVTVVVWFISSFLGGITDPTLAELLDLFTKCAPISIAITVSHGVLSPKNAKEPVAVPATKMDPAFFARLPVELGKNIYALQAQDHYVQVITARGKEMVLLRLEDAIRELEGVEGLKVHRSWWVAKNGVQKLQMADGKMALILKGGEVIPVSRTFLKAAKTMFEDL